MIRLALLTSDAREAYKTYDRPLPYFGTAPQALLEGLADEPEIHVDVVSCVQRPLPSPVPLASNCVYHGVFVPKSGWLRSGYQGCVRAVRKKLRELRPDVVHGQGTERDCAVCTVWSGFPNILTLHGNMRAIARVNRARPFSFEWLTARLESYVLPRTMGVVCITNYTRQAVASLAKRTWIVPNAVDPLFFELTLHPPPVRRILVIGRICHLKNQNAFIRALDSLTPDGKFEVVFLGGTGAQDPYAEEFARLLASRPWCRHVGFSGRDVVKQWLARATALVLPSLEDNCPMVVLEAMAAGIPVVASNVGGVPDLIEDGRTGWLSDPRDPDSIRRSVERLLNDQAGARAMAAQAQTTAWARYHPKVVARQHIEIYKEFLTLPPQSL